MRLAITSNGPGEFSGWVRPLVYALYERDPELDLSLFFVPDDYASGQEPDVARRLFPNARVFGSRDYVTFALGRSVPNLPAGLDCTLYLGGDLMHAARVRARLGGEARAYKFTRKQYRDVFSHVYAIDEKNAAQLIAWGAPAERIAIVGNLAVDGALAEAAGRFPPTPSAGVAAGGIVIMPGTRKMEIAQLIPFFLQSARLIRRAMPDVPISFALSPYTTRAQLEAALASGGDPRMWGSCGRVEELPGGIGIAADGDAEIFPIVHDAMRFAKEAELVVTIPGTKCIELAALGVPTIACTPMNAPELAVINGPLQYLDRIPGVGAALKRAMVLRVEAGFVFTAQPNIDAGEELMPELRGTLTPGTVAARAAAYAADDARRARDSERLRALYAGHAGAAMRLADALLGRAALEPAAR
jgi:hypothetical protein